MKSDRLSEELMTPLFTKTENSLLLRLENGTWLEIQLIQKITRSHYQDADNGHNLFYPTDCNQYESTNRRCHIELLYD